MKYLKPPLTYEQQVDLLISRGLIVSDKEYAVSLLEQISYYRFSAYCIPFQPEKDSFLEDTRIEDIHDLYRFDHGLRMLLFDALEKLEIYIRTSFIYFLAHNFGAFGYLDKGIFYPKFKHEEWIKNIEGEIERSKETFISHYREKYHKTNDFPIWMAAEIFSFGKLSQLYSGLHFKHQKKVAKKFGLPPEILRSWLHVLVYARNICAHHSRLWNRELAIKPKFPKKDKIWNSSSSLSHERCYAIFSIAYYLLKKIRAEKQLRDDLIQSIEERPQIAKLHLMGFSEGWENSDIWKT